MEPCPHCNQELNPQLHLVRSSLAGLPSALLGWERPSARRARKFTKPQPDGTLIKALARAWRWQRMLDEGVRTSVSEIGDAENISKTYVSRTLRRFGFITHENYVLVVSIICFAAVALLFLVRPPG